MTQLISKRLAAQAIAGAMALTVLGTSAPAAYAHEQTPPVPTISVSATGTAEIAPDMAMITLTVLREGETARAALDANTAAMADVLAAMQAEGIAERDLQTSNFSVQPVYVYPRNNGNRAEEPRIVGYRVHNSLTVRVRDLDRLGAILDTSVTLGVNQGGQIMFTNDDPAAAISEARAEAMRNAIAKARELTDAAEIGLGKIVTITEQSDRPQPIRLARAESAMVADSAPVPIAAGENSYRVTVNVTFELDQ